MGDASSSAPIAWRTGGRLVDGHDLSPIITLKDLLTDEDDGKMCVWDYVKVLPLLLNGSRRRPNNSILGDGSRFGYRCGLGVTNAHPPPSSFHSSISSSPRLVERFAHWSPVTRLSFTPHTPSVPRFRTDQPHTTFFTLLLSVK